MPLDTPASKLARPCVLFKGALEIGCAGFCFICEICALLLHKHVPSLVICEFLLCQWAYDFLRRSRRLVIMLVSVFMITLVTDLSANMLSAVTARHSTCPESHR